mgnify:CR=1 FL=1
MKQPQENIHLLPFWATLVHGCKKTSGRPNHHHMNRSGWNEMQKPSCTRKKKELACKWDKHQEKKQNSTADRVHADPVAFSARLCPSQSPPVLCLLEVRHAGSEKLSPTKCNKVRDPGTRGTE